MERFFREHEVERIIWYVCSLQKAEDYQLAGDLLLNCGEEGESILISQEISELLDNLCDTDNNSSSKITIDEIKEFLDSE